MPKCSIIFSNLEQPVGVEDKNGNPSNLFQQIFNDPNVRTFEAALNLYQNFYQLGQEPTLTYRAGDEFYNTYAQAVRETSATTVEAGVQIDGKFKPLYTTSTDTNLATFEGLVNNLIKSELITGETYTDVNGDKIYTVSGNSEYKRLITSDSAINTARSSVGYSAKRTAAGNLYFDKNLGKRMLLNVDENIEYVVPQEIDNKNYQQLKRETADPIGIMAERVYVEDNRAFGDKSALDEMQIVPENELQQKLLTLLQNLGIKTVSLEQYSKRFEVAPDAQALADIANQLIAFNEGRINQNELTEETAHFIIEASDPAQIENILRNIHRTKEWNEYAAAYMEIYQDEQLVRKEILGKVLANSLQQNFATRENSTETTIISRIRDVFNSFFDNIRAFFKPVYQQQLEEYTRNIYANLLNDSLFDQLTPQQFNGKKYTLYSIQEAMSPEYQRLKKALDSLSLQQYELQKKYNAPASQGKLREAKESLLEAIRENDQATERIARLKALTNIAEVANAQLNYLTRALETNENKGHHFSQEENSVYQNYIHKLEPVLSQINEQLSNKDRAEKLIKDKITQALQKGVALKGKIPSNNETAINNIVNRVVSKNNLSGQEEERFREQVTKVLTAMNQDTNWFHAHLGQLAHAQNALLNLAGDVIAKTVTDSRVDYLSNIKTFLNKIDATGFNLRDLKKLIDKSGYIVHEFDNDRLEQINLSERTRIYNEVTQQNIAEKDFKESLINELSSDDRRAFNNEWNTVVKERLESFFTKEHLEKLEAASVTINGQKITRSSLPAVALEYEKYYRGNLTAIRQNNGGINTESDKYEIQELNKQRAKDANPRNLDGTIKNGLREIYDENLQQFVLELDASTLTSQEDLIEAEKVYGLNMINLINREFYSGQERATGIPASFIEKLNEFETEQEKWEFVQLNAYVGFKQDFWDSFGQNETLTQRLLNQKDGENDGEIDTLIADIRAQQQIIGNILKANRVFNRPAETNVTEMSDVETGSIRDAAIRLESLYNQANSILPKEEQQEQFEVEARPNESFEKDLEDEGEERLPYILKHVTPNNANNIREAAKIVEKIRKGEEVTIRKSLQNTFNEEMSVSEAEVVLMRYAESKLLPYYKRSEPTGFTQALQQFEQQIANNEQGTVEDFISSNQYLEISPSYSFYGESDNINPRWLANREGKRPQYTPEFAAKIKNEEYYRRFGINEQGQPTTNLQEWNARQALLELQDTTIENLGLTGQHNRYLLPQQRKSGFLRTTEFLGNFKFENIRQNINDLVNFREDEAEVGQNEEGEIANSNEILTIPTYGVRKIEKQDVTDELLYSYAWMAQQSSLHKARKENIGNMFVIKDAILNADYAGKAAEATNSYKMFKSFLNANFYGVKESFNYEISLLGKKANLGKVAQVFNRWVKTVSLTNSTIPLTSLITAKVQKSVESAVGEHINPISSALAFKEFRKYGAGAAGEVMQLTSGNKINVIGEYFGLFDLTERFENSHFNRTQRGFLKLSSNLHALGNYPILPSMMLSVLMDYRYYNGKVVSYNQYLRRNRGENKKQLNEDWKKLDLYYNDIAVQNGQVVYKKENISAKTGLVGEELENFLKTQTEVMSNRVSSSVQVIDSAISESEKSIASRDARSSFFLNFLSWFTLQLTYRFKSSHYNIASENFQEGSYISVARFTQQLIMNPKNLKQVWDETLSDDTKRRNLRRFVIDMAVGNTLALAAILLAEYVDDDEDPLYGVAFLNYFLTRTTNEQLSASIALPKQFGQILDTPLIAAERFYDIFNVYKAFDTTEIDRGSYAGRTESFRYLSRNLPLLSDIHRLGDPKKAAQTYKYFNDDTLDWTTAAWLFDPENEE